MKKWALFVLTLVLALVAPARADETARAIPPAPTAWVTDNAEFLSEPVRASLSQRLEAYKQSSGHEVFVWIGETLGNVPLEDFTIRAFSQWKVGRKGMDDGVVLFLFAKDHKSRIEVGYGLEDKIPDAAAGRIVQEVIAPRLRANDHDGGVTAGVEAIVERLDGKLPPGEDARGAPQARRAPSLVETIFLIIGLIAVIAFLATHPSLAAFLLMSFFSGGRGGGGGFGGGGFGGGGGGGFSGGGGGRGGGGGASGSW